MKQSLCTITYNVEVIPGIHLMWIKAPDIACSVLPGQYITVRCGDFTLRRPFSIHQSRFNRDSGESEIALLFKVTGKGTLWLSQRRKGDKIDILGPLGKGFRIEPGSKNLLLVAGGVGIAPLVLLAQHALSQCQVILIHGASTANRLYPFSSTDKRQSKLFPSLKGVQFVPVTDDGSMGKKGMATDILPDFLDRVDQVCACGPLDMYKAMALTLNPSPLKGEEKGEGEQQNNLKLGKCQVSLEVRMGCGFGTCYGCTINTKKGSKQVCRDGPVFELDDIIWQEVRI